MENSVIINYWTAYTRKKTKCPHVANRFNNKKIKYDAYHCTINFFVGNKQNNEVPTYVLCHIEI